VILVDTSVWADHWRSRLVELDRLLAADQVAMHPFVLGEIAMGYLNPRDEIMETLDSLPKIDSAEDAEALAFIKRHKLFGTGIGYVDVHLLAASVLNLTPLWTHDKRLHACADKLRLAAKGLT
jgi:predicted nucleic acid-binding protein